MPTHVSQPQYDRRRELYAIRWTDDDGIRRAETTLATKAKALAFRARLLGLPEPTEVAAAPEMPVVMAPKKLPRPKLDAPGVDSAIEQAWQADLLYYRQAIRAAFDSRDEMTLELAAKAARAIGTLVTAHASNRDVRRLRMKLDELEDWRKSLSGAAQHGTRIEPAGQGGCPTSGPLRREESVH